MDPQTAMMIQALQGNGGGQPQQQPAMAGFPANGQNGALGAPQSPDQMASLGLPQDVLSNMFGASSQPGGMIGTDAPVSGAW